MKHRETQLIQAETIYLTDASSTTYEFGKFANAADLESSSTDYLLYVADNTAMSITTDDYFRLDPSPNQIPYQHFYNIAGKWDGANESYLLSQCMEMKLECILIHPQLCNYKCCKFNNRKLVSTLFGTYSPSSRTV